MNEFEEILNECSENVNELIALFVRCRIQYWDEKYINILDALNNLDSDLAIKLESKIPKTGMGGLHDIFICEENGNETENYKVDNAILESTISNISISFEKLKKYTNYVEK